MSSIATVDPKLLTHLDAQDAVDLFRDLLWAEAWRQEVPLTQIDVPSNITAPDGGVDAEVVALIEPTTTGLTRKGLTCYQIKSGEYAAHQEAKAKDLLFKEKSTDLKERVEYCLRNQGTFVVVLFGNDNPSTTEDDLVVRKCEELLTKYHSDIANPKIQVLRANQLAGELSLHVALSFRAQRISSAPFRTHREWASQSDMRPEIVHGPAQDATRKQLDTELRRQSGAAHVCLVGEPGAGKTRMALEATRALDLAPLVLYFPSSQKCHASGMVELLLRDARRHAILVVDDAELNEIQALWNTLERQGSRIKLVTLQHEMPRMGGSTVMIELPALDDSQIFEILQQYVPGPRTRGFVPLCSGSPRVAHVIGMNLQHYPNDLLQSADTVDVWGRYISGTDDPNGPIVRERRIILQHFALFRKFGCKGRVVHELDAIVNLINKNHREIDKGKVLQALTKLRDRRMLQGETTIYITPKALHIKLWSEWWELYGPHLALIPFVESLPPSLQDWFFDMLRYARESGAAARLVRELLGPDGPFVRTSLLRSARGAEVFGVLAEANPERALACLETTVGKESLDELRSNTEGRRQIVWALERIAVWRSHFSRATQLLERLALAENEPRIANNATGIFCDMFSLGPRELAPTETPPAERFPILQAMLAAESRPTQALAVQACGVSLKSRHFVRTYGREFQGLRTPPVLWRPETNEELFAAYEAAWTMLRDALPHLHADEQSQAALHLIQSAAHLAGIPRLGPIIIETFKSLARAGLNKGELIDQVEFVVGQLDQFPEESRNHWVALLSQLRDGTSFDSRLRHFVGKTSWRVDDTLTHAVEELAFQATHDKELLRNALPWLLSFGARNGYLLGYHLGKYDKDGRSWILMVEEVQRPEDNLGVLGGYLRAVKEQDAALWLQRLTECSTDERLAAALCVLVSQSGLTEEAGRLLSEQIKAGRIQALSLRQFVVGNDVRNLSEKTFAEWREFLHGAGAEGTQAVIELMHSYYMRGEPPRQIPVPDTADILTDQRLFAVGTRASGMLVDYSWRELAQAVVAADESQLTRLAEVILDHLGIQSALLQEFGDTGPTVWLREVAMQAPIVIWRLVKERLGPPIDRRAFHVKAWIDNTAGFDERRPNFLDIIPRQELWDWVDADSEQRAWYLAYLVAPILTPTSLARDVLIRYGHLEEVQENFSANFSSGGWTGPESAYLEGRRLELETLLASESEPRVREWITNYIERLSHRIELADFEEERRF